MLLSAGSRLGQYEIVASIGAGGMGEVYRAHDPRLRRDVAMIAADGRAKVLDFGLAKTAAEGHVGARPDRRSTS